MQLTDFTLDGGLLEIDIWGHGVGVGFDRLSVDGVARFVSGAIVFVFFDDVRGASFVPAPGDAFEFLTADGGIQGFDDNALLRLVSLGLDPAVEFLVRNTGTSLVLEIMAARQERQLETFGVPVFGVPLPPVLSLLLPALLLVRRRG